MRVLQILLSLGLDFIIFSQSERESKVKQFKNIPSNPTPIDACLQESAVHQNPCSLKMITNLIYFSMIIIVIYGFLTEIQSDTYHWYSKINNCDISLFGAVYFRPLSSEQYHSIKI